VTDRTVNVRLNLDNSGYRRGATESQQDNRRIAESATVAAAEQEQAFQRAAASSQRSFERTATVAQSSGRATQESVLATSASMSRLAVAAEEVPATFASAATVSSRALGEMATSASAAASSVVAAETRMSEATAASAAGIRSSLAMRLAAGEAVMAQQGAMAAATSASTTAQASGFSRVATASHEAEKALGGVRTAGMVMLAMFAAASVTAAKFEKSMSNVAAVSDATAEQMKSLRQAALEAGRDTSFSASQAADAEAELARAGVSVADILGGALRGALSLAAAGQLSLGEAATISAQAMNTFGLKGRDVAHIADVLAAGANKSASDVHGLGESLRAGGLLAHQTGLSLEDTVGVLASFADHALIGSDAGTSLKTMLMRLTPQSTEAANMMEKVGFSAYDAQGKFVGLTELARRMQTSFADLTPEARNSAMSVIFGSDAMRAATVVYEQGARGINKYVSEVNDSGAASRNAATQLDNLSGDLEALKGSIEVALIQSGTAANSILREMVQWVTRLVNAYASLPGWAQTTAVGILAVGGALAVAGAGFLLILPRIAAFETSVATLATTMPRLTAAATGTIGVLTNPWVAGIGLAISVITAFSAASQGAKRNIDDVTQAVKADAGAVADHTKALVAQKLEQAGVLDTARKYGVSLAAVTDAALGNKAAIDQINASLQENATHTRTLNKAQQDQGQSSIVLNDDAKKLADTMRGTSGDVAAAVKAFNNQKEATGGAADSTTALGTAAAKTADELGDTRTEAEKLTDTLNKLNGANIGAAQAAIGMQSSLADLTDTVKKNGTELDITTEKGRSVKTAMLGAAEAAQKHAEAVMKQTGSAEQANIVFGQDIEALKKVMTQAGFTKQQIDSLTAAYAQLPAAKATVVTDPGALQTIADLREVKGKVEDVPAGKSITVKAPSYDAVRDLQIIGYQVDTLPGGKQVRITVPSNDAFDGTSRIQSYINGITGKTVRVNIDGSVNIPGTHMTASLEADGGIVGFANGGVTAAADGLQTRQAGISSRAILWAEAGREAYIPMDPAKRTRSMSLLGQVAGEFGMQLVPVARDLIPARSLSSAPTAAASYDQSRSATVHLHGAQQSSQEQLADVVRHLQFIS